MKRNTPSSRKADVAPLKECLQELIEVYRLRGKLSETHIISSWEKLMGQTISKRTSDIFFQDKKLLVKITSAPLKQELQLSKSKIIRILNEEAGQAIVEDIVFL